MLLIDHDIAEETETSKNISNIFMSHIADLDIGFWRHWCLENARFENVYGDAKIFQLLPGKVMLAYLSIKPQS